MNHKPTHRDNPYRLSEEEQIPAKIWELLRRNQRFIRAVEWLNKLDERVQADPVSGQNSRHWQASFKLVEGVSKGHEFAGCALQWLVPEPIFIIEKVGIPSAKEENAESDGEPKLLMRGQGISPDPKDAARWQWWHQDMPEGLSRLFRRGPEVSYVVSDDPELADGINPLEEWREYYESKGRFTVEDSWNEAPPGFKRAFCFLWRQRDSKVLSPLTGARSDAPVPQEVDFFQTWNIGDELLYLGKGGKMLDKHLVCKLVADELCSDYRIFAVPRCVTTRSEARRMADWIYQCLCQGLPDRARDSLGSPLQWDIFLTVEDEMAQGEPFEAALSSSFDKIHLKDATGENGYPLPDQRVLWGQRGASWMKDYRYMNSEVKDGLIQLVFPRFPNVFDRTP